MAKAYFEEGPASINGTVLAVSDDQTSVVWSVWSVLKPNPAARADDKVEVVQHNYQFRGKEGFGFRIFEYMGEI